MRLSYKNMLLCLLVLAVFWKESYSFSSPLPHSMGIHNVFLFILGFDTVKALLEPKYTVCNAFPLPQNAWGWWACFALGKSMLTAPVQLLVLLMTQVAYRRIFSITFSRTKDWSTLILLSTFLEMEVKFASLQWLEFSPSFHDWGKWQGSLTVTLACSFKIHLLHSMRSCMSI